MSASTVRLLRAARSATRRSVALAVAVVTLGLVGTTSAQAHDVLRSTDPADGSTVAVAPDHVTLTFDEPALALGTEIEVRTPDGTMVSDGDPVLVDSTVTQRVAGELPAGAYTVAWRVTSVDGHPITGTFSFTATGATTVGDIASPTLTPSASTADDASTPDKKSSSAAVIVVLVIAAVIMSWLLWRRRRPRDVG